MPKTFDFGAAQHGLAGFTLEGGSGILTQAPDAIVVTKDPDTIGSSGSGIRNKYGKDRVTTAGIPLSQWSGDFFEVQMRVGLWADVNDTTNARAQSYVIFRVEDPTANEYIDIQVFTNTGVNYVANGETMALQLGAYDDTSYLSGYQYFSPVNPLDFIVQLQIAWDTRAYSLRFSDDQGQNFQLVGSGTIDSADMPNGSGLNYFTDTTLWIYGNTYEYGFDEGLAMVYWIDFPNSQDVGDFRDDLTDLDENPAAFLSFTSGKIVQSSCVIGLGGRGSAFCWVYNQDLANFRAWKLADTGQKMVIRDSRGVLLHFGEVVGLTTEGDHLIRYESRPINKRGLANRCNYNPVSYIGDAKFLDDDTIEDQDASFTTTWGNPTWGDALPVILKRASLQETVLTPHSYGGTRPGVSDVDTGELYHLIENDDNDITQGPNTYEFSSTFAVTETYFVDLQFQVWLKSGTSVSDAALELVYTGFNSSGLDTAMSVKILKGDLTEIALDNMPIMGVATARRVFAPSLNNVGGELVDFSDMLQDQSNDNGLGYDEYRFTVRINFGDPDTNNSASIIRVALAKLTISYGSDQEESLGQGILNSSTTATKLVMDNSTPSWAITGFPVSDGFGQGDRYFVGEWKDKVLVYILGEVMTDYGIVAVIDITDLGNHADIEDKTNTPFEQYLDEVTKDFNGIWFPCAAGVFVIRSLDNLMSTGKILQLSDLKMDLKEINPSVDASYIRTEVIIDEEDNSKSQSITPGQAFDQGSMETVYEEFGRRSKYTLDKKATSYGKIHTDLHEEYPVRVDWANCPVDLSQVNVGVKVGLDLPSTSSPTFANFSSGNDGELIVSEIQYLQSRNNEIAVITLQRREA